MKVCRFMLFRFLLECVCIVIVLFFFLWLLMISRQGMCCNVCLWILQLIFLLCKFELMWKFCFVRVLVMFVIQLVWVLVMLVIIIWVGVSQVGNWLVWCLIRMFRKCFIELMMVWCSMIGCFFWLFLFMYLVFRWLGIMKLICMVFSCQVWLIVFFRWYLIFGLQKVFLFGSFCYFMLQVVSVECSVFLVLFQVVLLFRCDFGCSVILIWILLKLKCW